MILNSTAKRKFSRLYASLAILFIFMTLNKLFAVDIIYTNGNLTNNWNDPLNWSTGVVPGNSDKAIFDVTSSADCNINANANVAGIDIQTTYSGTIIQNSGITITVGTDNFSMSAGSFAGSNAAILISGAFILSGGVYTSTSDTMTISGNYTFSSGSFNHNNGTVKFFNPSGNAITLTGNTSFYHLKFNSTIAGLPQVYTISGGTIFTSNQTLTIIGSSLVSINTGMIDAKGNILIKYNAVPNFGTNGGNATININGTVDQTLTGTGVAGLGFICSVNINKTAGTLFLQNVISVSGNWTYTQGTVNYGTSSVVFSGSPTITGTQSFNNLEFMARTGLNAPFIFTIASGTILTVDGTLLFDDALLNSTSYIQLNTGTIDAKGNIRVYNRSTEPTNSGGTATIHVCGTVNQTLTGEGTTGRGKMCKINIDKPSGTLFLSSVISTNSDWTWTQGAVDAGTSTVVFMDKSLTITGTHSLNKVTISTNTVCFITISMATALTINGTLTISGIGIVRINTGTINAKGDITVTNISAWCGGTGTLNINGTINQTLTGSGIEGRGALPNIIINKSGGILAFISIISIGDLGGGGNWTYTSGTVDASTNTSKVYMLNATNIDCENGAANMSFYDLKFGDSNIKTLTGDIRVDNIFTLADGRLDLNSNALYLTSNSAGALTRTSGYIISESTNNEGEIFWNVGATVGSYIYPFGTIAGTYIPLIFQLTAGNAGYVSVSTYPTASDNTPYPSTPDNVTNLLRGGTDNSTNVIDRFWQIDKNGPSGTATVSYTYDQAEVTGGVVGNEGLLQAQRYNTSNNLWDAVLAGQTADDASNVVTEPGITQFSPRTLALSSSPLPIELLSFTAIQNDRHIDLSWVTATETNNDYFTIERSVNGTQFEPIATVQGAGNSTTVKKYSTEDRQPFIGVSYYKLKQTDFDGNYIYSQIVPITFEYSRKKDFFVYPNPLNTATGDNLLLSLSGLEKDSSILVVLLDVLGKEHYSKIVLADGDGIVNVVIQSSTPLVAGVYIIRAADNNKLFCEKIVVK
ncbi:MAG: T9SS type A sorting domain-containing protein [Bacteroidetes bacterium]|nr:T9SS type A sorting domain-containing protein [Bacteroidota bacterium]